MATILIIDDETEVRATLSMLLQNAGYATIEAGDGISGVRAFAESRPSLVITDMLMPDCDGIETIREIRTLNPTARIIAISGGAQIPKEYYVRVAKAFGAVEVFGKPFEIDALLRAIKVCLSTPAAVQHA
jgi:CheY-like chemotaxis protein